MVSLGVDDGEVYLGFGSVAASQSRRTRAKSKARGKRAAKGGAVRAYFPQAFPPWARFVAAPRALVVCRDGSATRAWMTSAKDSAKRHRLRSHPREPVDFFLRAANFVHCEAKSSSDQLSVPCTPGQSNFPRWPWYAHSWRTTTSRSSKQKPELTARLCASTALPPPLPATANSPKMTRWTSPPTAARHSSRTSDLVPRNPPFS